MDRVVARYHDPGLRRFISADTIVPDPNNPQSLNRYSYCLNNPLKYVDPTGHFVSQDDVISYSANNWNNPNAPLTIKGRAIGFVRAAASVLSPGGATQFVGQLASLLPPPALPAKPMQLEMRQITVPVDVTTHMVAHTHTVEIAWQGEVSQNTLDLDVYYSSTSHNRGIANTSLGGHLRASPRLELGDERQKFDFDYRPKPAPPGTSVGQAISPSWLAKQESVNDSALYCSTCQCGSASISISGVTNRAALSIEFDGGAFTQPGRITIDIVTGDYTKDDMNAIGEYGSALLGSRAVNVRQ